jgi:hypothetical protein
VRRVQDSQQEVYTVTELIVTKEMRAKHEARPENSYAGQRELHGAGGELDLGDIDAAAHRLRINKNECPNR